MELFLGPYKRVNFFFLLTTDASQQAQYGYKKKA